METMSLDKRLPVKEDFAHHWTLTITPPTTSQKPTNVLVLFHGLGGSHEPFAKLGAQMNLPETACISVRAPQPLPFEPTAFHYGDDVIFDNSLGTIDPDGRFSAITPKVAKELIQDVLISKCGYKARDIMFFGFGQGGMVALNVAANLDEEFGGVISVGGALPAEAPASLAPKRRTPVLVCAGRESPWVNPSAEEKLKSVFESVQTHWYRRTGDTMPNSRDEMMPLMQFFARRLRSTAGVPEGSIELS